MDIKDTKICFSNSINMNEPKISLLKMAAKSKNEIGYLAESVNHLWKCLAIPEVKEKRLISEDDMLIIARLQNSFKNVHGEEVNAEDIRLAEEMADRYFNLIAKFNTSSDSSPDTSPDSSPVMSDGEKDQAYYKSLEDKNYHNWQ